MATDSLFVLQTEEVSINRHADAKNSTMQEEKTYRAVGASAARTAVASAGGGAATVTHDDDDDDDVVVVLVVVLGVILGGEKTKLDVLNC